MRNLFNSQDVSYNLRRRNKMNVSLTLWFRGNEYDKFYRYLLAEFRVYGHDMQWTLEINSNSGITRAWGILLSRHWKHYLHYYNFNGHLTWQGGDLAWPIDHVVLQDHMKNSNHYIATITMPMANKFGRVVTYLVGLLSMTFWSRSLARSHDKSNTLCLHNHNAFGHQTKKDGEI